MTLPERMKFEWQKISIGDLIQLILILGMIYAGWIRFDQRLTKVEEMAAADRENMRQVSTVMSKLSETLDKLQITLETFPLHRHLNDDNIFYPDGHQEKRGNGKASR